MAHLTRVLSMPIRFGIDSQMKSPDTTWAIFWQTDMIPLLFPGPYYTSRMFKAMERIPNID